MAGKNTHVPAAGAGGAQGAGPATEQAPHVCKNPALQMLFSTKIKDLPPGFYTSVTLGNYYIYVWTLYSEPPEVYVEKKERCGMKTVVKIKDPDPELTVGELVARIKNLIETSINRNCSGP